MKVRDSDGLDARAVASSADGPEFGAYTREVLLRALWLLCHLLALGASLAAAFVDIREHRLPNRLVAIVATAAVLLGVCGLVAGAPSRHLLTMALGALAFAGPLFVAYVLSPASLGFGDVKYAAAAGAFLGWYSPVASLWALAGAVLLAGPVALVFAVTGRRKTLMPLGPFLVASSVIVAVTEFAFP